jgi:tetratricopeptide (TPR) repeat protein
MYNNEAIISNVDESLDHVNETKLAQLNEFFRKYLKFTRKIKHDIYTKIKDQSLLINSTLAPHLRENFIYYKEAPWYWTYPNSSRVYLEKLYNINLKRLTSGNPQKMIFDFYNKWVFSNNNNDSKYFALSVIKQVKDSRQNALNLLMQATILAYEENLYNPSSSIIHFEEAEEVLHNKGLEDPESFDIRYIIKLFKGYTHLKQGNYDKAKVNFEEAIQLRENGINAKFHLALIGAKQGELTNAYEYTRDVYKYDISRISNCLQINSTALLEYYLENSICGSFFGDSIAYELLPIFESRINDLISSGQIRFDKLKEDVLTLKDIKWYKENGELVSNNINFIETYIKKFQKAENIFVLESISSIEQKFVDSIKAIQSKIENDFQEKIDAQLNIYDIKIKEDIELQKRIEKDLEVSKKRLVEKRDAAIKNFEFTMEDRIESADNRVKNLDFSEELNPANSFKNSMMYSFMLAMLVLVLGGFAEYSNGYGSDSLGVGSVVAYVILGGSKWGVLTFIIGVFISLMMSATTSLEKAKIKQRYIKELSRLKEEKTKGIRRITEDSESALKALEERTNAKLNSFDAQIKELQQKKIQDEKNLRENVSARVKEETITLQELIDNYK